MFTIKTLIPLVLVSSVALVSSVQAQATPTLGATASANVPHTAKGAKAHKRTKHVNKPSAQTKTVAKKNHKTNDKPADHSKGPGLEAF